MAATNKMICHDHATQGHHRTGNTSGAPAEQTVEVYAPDTKTLYQVPTSGISHLGCQDSNASTPTPGRARHLICRSYCNAIEEGQRPSEVTACAMGKQCRFVHVDIPLSKVKGDVIHVHYVYRDEALCGYERLSTAMARDHPEISAEQASSMMLMIYGPNNREPVERIPPSRLLLTGGSRYALECTVNPRRTNHGLPEQPRVCHCAHYYFTQTCNRGANCSFIHVVSVDATQKADSSKPANYRRRVTQLGQVEVPQMGMGTPQVGYHSSTMNTPATAQHTNGQNNRSVPSSPHQQHQTSPNVHNTNAPTPSAINPYPASQRRNNNSRGPNHNATDASVSMMNDSMQGTPATRRAVPAAISTDSCNNSHTNYQPRNNARPNNGGSPTLTANHHKANNSSTSGMVNSTTLLPLTTTDGHATSVGSVVNFAMPVNANVCPPPPLQATVGSQRSTPAMAAHGRVPYPIVGNGSVPPPPPVAFGDDAYVQVGRAAPTSAGQRGTNNMLPMDDVDGDEGYGYDGHEECGAAYAPPIQTGNNNNSQHCGYSSTGSPHTNQHYSTTSFGGRGGMGMDIGCLYQSPNQQAYSSHNTADADRATYSTSTGSYYNNQSEQQFNLQKNGGSVEGSYFSNYASPSSPATNAGEHRQYANSNRASPAGTPGTAMHRSLGTPKVVAAGRFAHNPYAQSPVTAAHNPYAQSPVTVQAQV